MAVHPRNLLLFLLLSGAAMLTFVLSRDSEPPVDPLTDREPAPRAFYLLDAILEGTDEEGRVMNRIFAERVEQEPASDDLYLDGIRVEYTAESNIHWDLTAANGYMTRDQSYFELADVRLTRTAGTEDAAMSFEAPSLSLDADLGVASSSGAVVFRRDDTAVRAVGMTLDLETDKFMLDKDATTRINR